MTQPDTASVPKSPELPVNASKVPLSFWEWSNILSSKHEGSHSSSPTSEGNRFPSQHNSTIQQCLKSSCAVLPKEFEQRATLRLFNSASKHYHSSKLKNPSWLDKRQGGLRGSWRHTNNLTVEKEKGGDYTPPSRYVPTRPVREHGIFPLFLFPVSKWSLCCVVLTGQGFLQWKWSRNLCSDKKLVSKM